jgi:hypothetical protein
VADTEPNQGQLQYDDTIPTPADPARDDDQDPNPVGAELGSDSPPSGDQPAADGALHADGSPLRANGTPARDKGEVS